MKDAKRAMPGDSLPSYAGRHAGQDVIVCGCGRSLGRLRDPAGCVTIGVNDVGRFLDPTYLLVVNPPSQFDPERWQYVYESRASAVFSHLRLDLAEALLVSFQLGRRGGTEPTPERLPYTQNSPYVAACLAFVLGARRIGLLGVDFTDDHFFADTGRHPLSGRVAAIDAEYARLAAALLEKGTELVNLSRDSKVNSLPRGRENEGWDGIDFGVTPSRSKGTRTSPRVAGPGAKTPRQVVVQRRGKGVVGSFLDAIATGVERAGYRLERVPARWSGSRDIPCFVWNGRGTRSKGPVFYAEHGWLPRWDFQLSSRGINADSHIAPFRWDGSALSAEDEARVGAHLSRLRQGDPSVSREDMRTDGSAVDGLPDEYVLVPLQIETDTNIVRHVPRHLRRMQRLVDHVSAADPPYPIVFKQHPADHRGARQHLRLKTRRPQDCIRRHDAGNVYQVFKAGGCRAVVSLNSNVVHDAFLWDVPSIALGRNVWPTTGPSPILRELPHSWEELHSWYRGESVRRMRVAYIRYLIRHQWTLDDARDPARIKELLSSVPTRASRRRVVAQRVRPRLEVSDRTWIDVACESRGWLLDDLKSKFAAWRDPGLRVTVSDRPRPGASAWILLRTAEARRAIHPARTLVHIHDTRDDGLYAPRGARRAVASCGGLVLVAPGQRACLEANGIDLSDKLILERPIGPSAEFTPRESLASRFTVGWVGRPTECHGVDSKRAEWIPLVTRALASRGVKFELVLLGERLHRVHAELAGLRDPCRYLHRRDHPHAEYPSIYRELDAVLITASEAAGPHGLYEALATGVPVVGTPVGQLPRFVRHGENGFLADDPESLAEALFKIATDREGWLERAGQLPQALEGLTLETWVRDNLRAATRLARTGFGVLAG